MRQYEQFSAEELAMHPNFQEWVLHPTDAADSEWQRFIDQYPHRRMVVDEAIFLVKSAGISTDRYNNDAYLEGWRRVEEVTNARSVRKQWTWYAAAAAVVGVIALATAYFTVNQVSRNERYETSFGETREIALTDGSKVTLNANSVLVVDDMGSETGNRVMTLHGDAFFDVKHTEDDRPFIVQTTGDFKVQVLGTAFEVKQRANSMQVLLKVGKVNIVAADTSLILRPGQLATAMPWGMTVSEPSADALEARLSWVDGQYVMNDESLESVAEHITQHFGKQVIIEDGAMRSTTVSGKVPANNLDVLLEVLQQTLHLTIVEEEGSLYIRSTVR